MRVRLTIEDMHAAASHLGGQCLSAKYVNNQTLLRWRCVRGHEWSAIPMSVRKGHWCPTCASQKRGVEALLDDGLERCIQAAASRGGRVISTHYLGSQKPIDVECAAGHRWNIRPSNLWRGKWCPYCAGNKVGNVLEDLATIASERGGRLLSKTYRSSTSHLEWECSRGHRWRAIAGSVKRGSWCPTCAGFRTKAEWYEAMNQAIRAKGGLLVSSRTSFVGPRKANVWVECKNHHRWRTSGYNLVSGGSWCKRCRMAETAKRLTIEAMRALAEKRGGRCVSEEYADSQTHLEWECAQGHRWTAKPANIASGRWCPECSRELLSGRFRRKDAISHYASIAEHRRGKLLSVEEPRNSFQKLRWQCARGHEWLARPNNIQNGRWCPICSSGYGERICRVYFETLFGAKFPSSWPDWLVINGTRRQLDGYCADQGLAFEHQGGQHYEELHGSHFARVPLARRKAVDQRKVELCARNGVKLIQIPEVPRLTKLAQLRDFLRDECHRLGVRLPKDFLVRVVDLRSAWNPEPEERLATAAAARGGKCLSTEYLGLAVKYWWQCSLGHKWEALGSSIVHRKSWCPQCHRDRISRLR